MVYPQARGFVELVDIQESGGKVKTICITILLSKMVDIGVGDMGAYT